MSDSTDAARLLVDYLAVSMGVCVCVAVWLYEGRIIRVAVSRPLQIDDNIDKDEPTAGSNNLLLCWIMFWHIKLLKCCWLEDIA